MSATISQLPPYASMWRIDSSLGTGGRFGDRRPWESLESRWQDAVWRHVADLLQIRNWKMAERKREVWRKEIGKAMAGKQAEAP